MVSARTRFELISVFAAAKGFAADQLRIHDLYEAYVSSTHTYWATATFEVGLPITEAQAVSLQDGGDRGVFSRVGTTGAWQVSFRTDPWPCGVDVPRDVLKVWGMSTSACWNIVSTSPTAVPAPSPDPTRPPANAQVPSLCTQPPITNKITPSAAEEAHAAAMARALCAYGVQLGAVWMLENAMSIGGLDGTATGLGYDVQLSYRVGSEYRGIWIQVDRPQPGRATGGQPVIAMESTDTTTATAMWPDGTRVRVQGMVWSPGPGGSANPLPDPSVLAVIASDPVFDAFADADLSASPAPAASPSR